jgi:hypothetical protein
MFDATSGIESLGFAREVLEHMCGPVGVPWLPRSPNLVTSSLQIAALLV